jgi:signal transduction histidine kinase
MRTSPIKSKKSGPLDALNRIIHTIFRSGVTDPNNIELRGRIFFFHTISAAGIAILLPFGLSRLFQGAFRLGFIDSGTAVFLAGLSLYQLITKRSLIPRIFSAAAITGLYGYLTLSTGYQNTGFVWSFTLPAVCLFMLGRKPGTMVLVLYMLMMVICFLIPAFPAHGNYSAALKISYPIAFFSAWIVAYFFSYLMSSQQNEILQKNKQLEKTIQELGETKDQLFQAQKMEAIGRLAGGVAHDFNNILAAITGYADLLQQRFGTLDPKLDKYASSILDFSKRAADLTAKLLSYARKGKIEMAIVDVHAVIGDVIDICKHTMNKNIILRQDLHASGAAVMGDRNQLQNALINLAVNAQDAMPRGGDLVFASEILDLTEAVLGFPAYTVIPGRYVKFTLTDTGIGMDAETLSRAMEPFFTTKEKGKGTGLGLASVFGTVKSHNGYFELASNINQGTRAEIYLPLTENVEEKAREVPQEIPKGHGRILLVDDEEMVRTVATEMIDLLGYSVVISSDGQNALEYYKSHWRDIDLVVLDIVMPRLGGYDCFMAMKEINPGIKAFVFSGYVVNNEVKKMLAHGAAGFVQKPFDIKSFSKAIQGALNR